MEISTPALLFGSISLLLLAYTNRFFVIAKLIRDLHKETLKENLIIIQKQIPVLKKRLFLIKYMQVFGVFSFILCTGSLFSIFMNSDLAGKILFAVSVLSLLLSLTFALWEVIISTKALDVILCDVQLEKKVCDPKNKTTILNPAGNWSFWTEKQKEEIKNPGYDIGEEMILETDSFRVWAINLKPAHRLPFHKHNRPYFWTACSYGKAISYFDDGSVVESAYEINDIKNFSDLSDENYFVHDLKNIGETTLVFTTVEFLK